MWLQGYVKNERALWMAFIFGLIDVIHGNGSMGLISFAKC
jgi:hypothetical protein